VVEPKRTRKARVDDAGFAFAGSMLQTQLYVNDHPEQLNAAILAALPELEQLDPEIRWVSPLRADGYREFWDAAFLRALGFDELAERLADWWPRRGGPHWDALARLDFSDGTTGVLLAEGKSYPAEMRDPQGLGATTLRSIATIERALKETQRWLGVDKPVSAWTRPYYQSANRLATLYWLLRELGANGGWLVHLCFLNDQSHRSPELRSTREQWKVAFADADAHLGITRPIPNYTHVFLDGLARSTPAASG
jgi:hypothetical protein